jgi:transcriptional regulator with XRE-family HTH domain
MTRNLVVAPHLESADNRTTLDNEEFGNLLKGLRWSAGLTQKEAAKRTYETVSYLRMFEKGQRVPQAGRAANIFSWYGVPFEVIHSPNSITLVVGSIKIKFLNHYQR